MFFYMQHIFGGLAGTEQGRNWPFQNVLDTYFLRISTEVAKYRSGTKKKIISSLISSSVYHYPTCSAQNAAVTVILQLFLEL